MSNIDPPTQSSNSEMPTPNPELSPTVQVSFFANEDSEELFPPEVNNLLVDCGLDPNPTVVHEHNSLKGDRGFQISPPTVAGYRILSILGEGGMGIVYKAMQSELNRPVAIKMIRPDGRMSSQDIIRFMAEAESVAAIKHPNVVEVYSCSREPKQPYFVMEYVAGGSLSRLLQTRGSLSPNESASILSSVARGVQAAHETGIIHRDLKPGNILLGQHRAVSDSTLSAVLVARNNQLPDIIPKISDFGLAKRLGSLDLKTLTNVMLGTPAYMAPEQARGDSKFVGPEADVYAMGVILYECLTGSVPFKAAQPLQLLHKVSEEMPSSPRSRSKSIPRDLDWICMKCLAKVPEHRYRSAAALADDLDRFLCGASVIARPVSALTRTTRAAIRKPALSALIALILLIFCATPAGIVWYQGRVERFKSAAAAQSEAHDLEVQARQSAENLAFERELFALKAQLHRRSVDRFPGWTWQNQGEILQIKEKTLEKLRNLGQLPAEAAMTLLSADFHAIDPVGKGLTASVAATNPVNDLIALGEFKTWGFANILNGRIWLVDPASGKTVRELLFPAKTINIGFQDGIRALLWSDDGSQLQALTRSKWIHRFRLENESPLPEKSWEASSGNASELAISPNQKFASPAAQLPQEVGDIRASLSGGRVLLATKGSKLKIVEPNSLRVTGQFADSSIIGMRGVDDRITVVAVHPGGGYIATGAEFERTVAIWNYASGKLVGSYSVPGTDPIGLAWSRDGNYLLVTGSQQTIRLQFRTPLAEQLIALQPNPVEAAVSSREGDRIATLSSLALPGGSTKTVLLQAKTNGSIAESIEIPQENSPSTLIFEYSGYRVLTLSKAGISRWIPERGYELTKFNHQPVHSLCLSRDGQTLWGIVDENSLAAWSILTEKPIGKIWRNNSGLIVLGLPHLDCLVAGSNLGIVSGRDGFIRTFNNKVEYISQFPGTKDPVTSLALSPSERLVVGGTQSGQLRLIDLVNVAEQASIKAHIGRVTSASFNCDGQILATGSNDRTIKLWRQKNGSFELITSIDGLPTAVQTVQFTRNRNQLMVLLRDERGVRLWDIDLLLTQIADLTHTQ